MKKMFYSDKLNKFYEEDQLELAEKEEAEFDRKEEEKLAIKNERKRRADEIEAARKAREEANTNYINLVNKFVEDYGSYHHTETKKMPVPAKSLFDMMFDHFWF